MIRRDLDAVVAIEKDSFDFPWSRAEFCIAMQQSNCVGMVAERNEELIGYMVYQINKYSIELLNFAVRSRSQRLGVGADMVRKLKDKLAYQRRYKIVAEVRESNLDAQLFFRSQGFLCTSIHHGFYHESETSDAAYRMVFSTRRDGGCNGV
jgi:ribosomal-protein-alanine N-acetyltransferase